MDRQWKNQDGTLDTLRWTWTVDKHEYTVDNFGHMVENWTSMSGQLQQDSGNQKHSDLEQLGCWTRQKASEDSTGSEARKKTSVQAEKRMLKESSHLVDKLTRWLMVP